MNLSDLLHAAAHRLADDPYCRCSVVAYQKAWKAARDAQERRARLIREEGLPPTAEGFEDWIRRRNVA